MIDFENGSIFKLRKSDGAGKEVEQLLIPGEVEFSIWTAN